MSTQSSSPIVFDVAGMDCADCARSVERVVARLPLVDTAEVSFGTGTLSVVPQSTATAFDELSRAVSGAVERAGYVAAPRVNGERTVFAGVPWWKNRKIVPTVVGAVIWLIAFTALHAFDQNGLSIALFAVAILAGGYPIARSAFASIQARRLDMNVLMSISVVGAALLGDWSEGALVVVLFSIGTSLQALAFERTRSAIRGLLDQAPEEALVVRGDVDMTVAARDLIVGDIVRIRPGDRLPADGEVISGSSAVQQAAITGESMPVGKVAGDPVYAGTLNGAGSMLVRVNKPASQSMLANIVHLVEEAQSSKAPSQQLVDRFSNVYTPVVVLAAAAIAVIGWLIVGDPGTWTYRALVLLVIACPCALVISTPVSIVAAIGAATRMGTLVKGGAALEDLARIRTIAFDKTGTLTLGRPSVTAVLPAGDLSKQQVLRFAAAIEGDSEHPLARAVVSKAMHDELSISVAQDFTSLTGMGASATVDGRRLAIGSERLLDTFRVNAAAQEWVAEVANRYGAQGETALILIEIRENGAEVLGIIAVADRLRPGAADALQRLRAEGITNLAMLSGDRTAVAESIGGRLGMDQILPELMPNEKLLTIEQLRLKGPVAMVGDGINDAPALAAADVGVAMGLGGTDVALESADIVLMRDDLGALASIVNLSKQTLRVIRQNVALSMLTKALALILAVFGFVSLWIAVLVDVGTSLLVTFNGLRLARLAEETAIAAPAPVATDAHDESCGCGDDHGHDHGAEHGHDHRRAAD